MSKEICISSTPHETRLAIVEDDQLTEVYYERENEYTLAGSIYKGRVTRVLPGMQSAFVDVGLERDAFLYVTDFLEEQEDSADFERISGGRDAEREAAGAPASSPSLPSLQRSGSRAEASEPGEEEKTASSGDLADGARRWRGRRGRRGRTLRGNPPQGDNLSTGALASAPAAGRETAASPIQAGTGGRSGSGGEAAKALPLFLPGESLSKYGVQENGQSNAQDSASVRDSVDQSSQRDPRSPSHRPAGASSKPSTLIETPLSWSGAGPLPGESISRYREEGRDSGAQSGPPSGDLAELSEAGNGSAVEEKKQLAAANTEADAEMEDASASHRHNVSAPSQFRAPAPPPSLAPPLEDEEKSFPAVPEIELHFRGHLAGNEASSPQVDGAAGQMGVEEEQPVEGLEEEHADDLAVTDDWRASGASLLEEEEVSEEEEYDFTALLEHAEDSDFDELEEETLDHESTMDSQVGELVRDAHLDRRLNASSLPAIDLEEGEDAAEGDESEGDEEEAEESEEGDPEQTAERTQSLTGDQPARQPDRQRRFGRSGRQNGRRRNNGRRQTSQTSELPIISELLKQGQEILVQIAKEPIAKKGARITSHIALPGRFLVFMPTVDHVGVSRKISSDGERQRLKRILISEKGSGGGGFIVRTAADGASEDDLRADIRFLISLWTEIKQRADDGKAPALIYHDLNLIERILRDRVSDNFSTIWVDSESEYERIVRFLNRFQPSLVRRVKLYTKDTPLFEQFGIQEEIGRALKSKVWLKSGGSIVINQTEALVAIDINTGKYVGKTARLEDTILKTNLDAIPEIVRQIRLRDLGGIIVIDFIDMDERRNRHKVMQALEEALKADRAPSKVLQFNDFGLVAITRKRVKQSLERTLCVQCGTCAGTGMVKSPPTVANEIYVEMRKMQKSLERKDVLLRVHPEVVKTLKANNGRWLAELEEMSGKTILVKGDPALPPEQFDIH